MFILLLDVQILIYGKALLSGSVVLPPFQIISRFDFLVYPFYYVSRHIIISRCIAK
jgi:hypothetical protein